MKFLPDSTIGRGSRTNPDDPKAWESVRPASDKAREREQKGVALSDTYSWGHEDSRQERFRVRHKDTGGFLRDFSAPARELHPAALEARVAHRVTTRIQADPGAFDQDVQRVLDEVAALAAPKAVRPPMHHLPAHQYGHPTMLGKDFVYEDGGAVRQTDSDGKDSDAFATDWKHEWVHAHWSKDHTGLARHAQQRGGQTDEEAKAEAKAIFAAVDVDRSGSVSAAELLSFLKQGGGVDGKPKLGVSKADVDAFVAEHDGDGDKQLDEAEFAEFFRSHGNEELPYPWCYLRESAVQEEDEQQQQQAADLFIAPKDSSSYERAVGYGAASSTGSRVTEYHRRQRSAQDRRLAADLLAKQHRHRLKQKREAGIASVDERPATTAKASESLYARRMREKKKAFHEAAAAAAREAASPEAAAARAKAKALAAKAAARRSGGGVTRRAWDPAWKAREARAAPSSAAS